MLKGLKDLNALGKANRDLLTNIGFDLTLLDQAAKMANELEMKHEAASFSREDYCEAKKIRHQAFTHLKEAVDLIRQCGQYVFWRNAARFKGYRSSYLRKVRMRFLSRKSKPGTGPGRVKTTA